MHNADGRCQNPRRAKERPHDSLQPIEGDHGASGDLGWDAMPDALESAGTQMPHISEWRSAQEDSAQFLMQHYGCTMPSMHRNRTVSAGHQPRSTFMAPGEQVLDPASHFKGTKKLVDACAD